MTRITQLNPSPLLDSYLTFVTTTVGLYPYGFGGDSALRFSALANDAPTHACLYVPHLGYHQSPVYRRFYHADGNQREDTKAKKYPSNCRTTFATEFVRLQKIIDDAIEFRNKMKDPYKQVPHAARVHRHADRTPDSLLYSAVLLSSIQQRADSMESPARFLLSAACQVENKDAKAFLTELAYAARKKSAREHHATGAEDQKKQLMYAEKMIRAWFNALILTQDPTYKHERIFAGMRACFASAIHLRSLAQFLDQLYLLPPNPSVEDDLRIALAKLVFVELNNRHRRTALEFAAQKMRNAVTHWERKPQCLEYVPAVRQMLLQMEHGVPKQIHLG